MLRRKKTGPAEGGDRIQNEEEQIIKTAPRKTGGTRTGILLILLAGAVCFGVLVYFRTREYKGYKVVNTGSIGYENTAEYLIFGENLLKYTADGVSYINKEGDVVWTTGINMKKPIAVVSGRYAVVADMNGNSVCVFDIEGEVSNLTMPYKICDVDVANQGAFAVVLESDKTNYINLYNKHGEMIYEMQTTIDKSGYPLDIAISNDGEKLFTSYMSVGAQGMENNLAAYNFGDVGQNSNADRMVGGYKMSGQVVPRVEFADNDTVVAFGTHSLNIYGMKEKPNARKTIPFDKEIKSVFSCESYVGVVQPLRTATDTDAARPDEDKYRIRAYNLRGNRQFDVNIDFEYDAIYATDDELIVTGGNDCAIIRKNGSIKYRGKLDGKIVSMAPAGGMLSYVVVYEDRTELIKLKLTPNKKMAEES